MKDARASMPAASQGDVMRAVSARWKAIKPKTDDRVYWQQRKEQLIARRVPREQWGAELEPENQDGEAEQ